MIEAENVIGLCRMFGCLPSQLQEEDATLYRYLKVLEAAGSDVHIQRGE